MLVVPDAGNSKSLVVSRLYRVNLGEYNLFKVIFLPSKLGIKAALVSGVNALKPLLETIMKESLSGGLELNRVLGVTSEIYETFFSVGLPLPE